MGAPITHKWPGFAWLEADHCRLAAPNVSCQKRRQTLSVRVWRRFERIEAIALAQLSSPILAHCGAEAGPVRMAGVEPAPMLIREGLALESHSRLQPLEHLDGDCQQTVELSARRQRPTGRSRMAWRPVLPSS